MATVLTLQNLRKKTKKSNGSLGITIKLFGMFVAFAVLVLALLWVFQVVLLDAFYKNIKVTQAERNVGSIATNIDNDSLINLANRIAQDGECCIKIMFIDSGETLDVLTGNDSCVLHHLTSDSLYRLFVKTQKAGGTHIEYYKRAAFKNNSYDIRKFFGNVPQADTGLSSTMIYCRTVETEKSGSVLIMLNSAMYPVEATVETLKILLFYETIIMLVIALVLALVFSRMISRPIVKINDKAKILATGNYNIDFTASGYREIEELGSTLNHTASELARVDELRNELIANISHDLRTPLTLISGYAEVMRDIPGENTPENVQIIIDESNHLAALVSDILDLSKLQSGAQSLDISRFSITDAIKSIMTRYAKLIEQRGFVVSFEHDETINIFVNADEMRILQVIYNLVNNAINYTGESRRVTLCQRVENGEVIIEVTDYGPGIAADKLEHIWDRYYKVDKEHRRAAVGTGLGLSIVKGVLQMHLARFGVRSTIGEGSTFWFALPVDSIEKIDK